MITCSVVDIQLKIQRYIKNVLTANGIPAAAIPWIDATQQFAYDPGMLPLTLLEQGDMVIALDKDNVGSVTYEIPVMVRHIRAHTDEDLQNFGVDNESQICQGVLAFISAAICNDVRLGGLVQRASPQFLYISNKDELDKLLIKTDQAGSLAGACLGLKIEWIEN